MKTQHYALLSLLIGAFATHTSTALSATAPDDPRFAKQWGLEQSTDIDIDAAQAWKMIQSVTQPKEIIVAVIDTGIDSDHPDLRNRLWTNPNEVAGNGIDDDNNGYVDDIHGWNWIEKNDGTIGGPEIFDQILSHATPVAGTIAAHTNNGASAAGVVGELPIKIMPLWVVSSREQFFVRDEEKLNDAFMNAFQYALDNGAHIINVSAGGAVPSLQHQRDRMADLIAQAEAKGVMIVSAALNVFGEAAPLPTDWQTTAPPYYNEDPSNLLYPEPSVPSALTEYSDAVISVSAIDRTGALRFQYSAGIDAEIPFRSAQTVNVAAPGYQVPSIFPLRDLIALESYTTGTSFATPHVTGIAAIALSVTNLLEQSPAERLRTLKQALINGSKKVDPHTTVPFEQPMVPLHEQVTSGGVISAAKVLQELGFNPANTPQAAFSYSVDGEQAPATVTVTGLDVPWDDHTISQYVWDFGDGTQTSGTQVSHTYSQGGEFPVRVTAIDTQGNARTSLPATVKLRAAVGDHVTLKFGGELPISVSGTLVSGNIEVTTNGWRGRFTRGEGDLLNENGERVHVAFTTSWSALGLATGTASATLADGQTASVSYTATVAYDAFNNATSLTMGEFHFRVIDQN